MLRGDLHTTSLADLLRQLAASGAAGCIYLRPESPGRQEALVALRGGAVSSVVMPGTEDAVGSRLVVTGHVPADVLASLRTESVPAARATDPSAPSLPDLLIRRGLADERLVCTLVLEQALADLSMMCSWKRGGWRFRRREPFGPALPTPLPVAELLAAVEARHAEWRTLVPIVGGADTVVVLAATSTPGALELDVDSYALLCRVDGVRTVGELAAAVGVTALDAARALAGLVAAGLVAVETRAAAPASAIPAPAASEDSWGVLGLSDAAATDAAPIDAVTSALARVAAPWKQPPVAAPTPARETTTVDASLAAALTRVSAALDVRSAVESASDDADSPEPDLRSHAALLLSQLAGDPIDTAQPAEPARPAVPAAAIAAARRDPWSADTTMLTDTAALMRELSSLGNDDTGPVTVSRPSGAPGQNARKRKGLFGRS